MLYIRYQYIFSHVFGIDLNENNNIINMKWYDYIFLNLYYMMNINFYVKSMRSFIILSIMWYERLTKYYLLHIDWSYSRNWGKHAKQQAFIYQLWITGALLNILLGPPNHDSQNSLDETHKLGS